MKDFAQLDLIEPLRRAITARNYSTPTPIQARAIPSLLAGRDVLGCAQTGTGKTAAFALPVLQHLAESPTKGRRKIRALILSPTRELAGQIGECFEAYGAHLNLRHMVVFGGVNEKPQIRELERGIDILVACPGRLLDLHGRGYVDLSGVEFFVLDEADRMLDMGFVHDVRRIIKVLSKDRQNLLFSATMPKSVADLAASFLKDPVRIDIEPETTTAEAIDQKVMFVEKSDKTQLLCDLLDDEDIDSSIVFTRTKHGANRLTKRLEKAGFKAAAIHGNKSQNARLRALSDFQDRRINILVATDVASRGIDVDTVTHVFNFDLPNEPESYVHRVGRTGRAGRSGTAIAFCDEGEAEYLQAIEKILGEQIETDEDHDFHQAEIMSAARKPVRSSSKRRTTGGRGRSSRNGNRNSRNSNRRGNNGNRSRSRSGGRNGNRGGNGRREEAVETVSSDAGQQPRRVRRDRRPLSERD